MDQKKIKYFKKSRFPVYICSHIFSGERDILYITRDGDDWQFLCGEMDHVDEIPKVVSLGQLVEKDISIIDVFDLLNSKGEAERESKSSKWKIRNPR